MKHSLRAGGGYLQIDHRESPGLTPADVAHVVGAIAVGKGQNFEGDVYVCSHCSRQIVLDATPATIDKRGYCGKCHHFICNSCERMRVATGGQCVPFKAVLERAAEVEVKFAGQPDHPDAVFDLEALSAPAAPRIFLTDAPHD